MKKTAVEGYGSWPGHAGSKAEGCKVEFGNQEVRERLRGELLARQDG